MKQDKAMVICMRWPEVTVPGSKRVPCSMCGEDVGISPATQEQIRQSPLKTATPICHVCFPSFAEAQDEEPEFVLPTGHQIEEILGDDVDVTDKRAIAKRMLEHARARWFRKETLH